MHKTAHGHDPFRRTGSTSPSCLPGLFLRVSQSTTLSSGSYCPILWSRDVTEMCLHEKDDGFQLDMHFRESGLKSTIAWQGITPPAMPSDTRRLPSTK